MTTQQQLEELQKNFEAQKAAILQEENKNKSSKGKGGSSTKKNKKEGDKSKEPKAKGSEVDPLMEEIETAKAEALPRLQKASRKALLAEVASWWEGQEKIQKEQEELYSSLETEDLRKQILFDWGLDGGESFFDEKGQEKGEDSPPPQKEEKKESKASSPKKTQSSPPAKGRKEPAAKPTLKSEGKQAEEQKPGKAFDEFFWSNDANNPRKDHILVGWWNSETEEHSLGGKNERGAYISVAGMKAGSPEWIVAKEMARACALILSKQTPPKGFDKVAVMK